MDDDLKYTGNAAIDRFLFWIINEVPLRINLWRGYYSATRRDGHSRVFSIRNGHHLMKKAMRD